jgi:flagellar biosynthesis/type III secretory pathway chaperone
MTPAITRLEEALTAELRLTQAIAALAGRERAALEDDDLTMLADVVREKASHLAELAEMESARNQAAEAWAFENNIPTGPATFEQIIGHMDRASARELGALRDGIRAHLDYARSMNIANRALLEAALDRNAALRNFLLGTTMGGDGYTASGTHHASAVGNHFMEWSG